jgi:hypothetical protein
VTKLTWHGRNGDYFTVETDDQKPHPPPASLPPPEKRPFLHVLITALHALPVIGAIIKALGDWFSKGGKA